MAENTKVVAITDPVKAEDVKTPEEYDGCKTHIVKAGESLYDIANANVVALQQLRYFNNIKHNSFKVREGQTIYIPKEPVFVPVGE